MNRKMYYISGLPRSGGTLLGSILNQNPRFFYEIHNPLYEMMNAAIGTISMDAGFSVICPSERTKSTIEGMFDGYYRDVNKEVIFNSNRGWTHVVEHLHELNSEFKIVCTVRDIVSIMNSMEHIFRKRGFVDGHQVYMNDSHQNVWTRTMFLANQGFVRTSLDYLREAYYGMFREHLLFVEYDELVADPAKTMTTIYEFLDEPKFEHDFNNVEFSYDEFDGAINMRNLHKVRSSVKRQKLPMILPPDLCEHFRGWEFWRRCVT